MCAYFMFRDNYDEILFQRELKERVSSPLDWNNWSLMMNEWCPRLKRATCQRVKIDFFLIALGFVLFRHMKLAFLCKINVFDFLRKKTIYI